MVGAGTTGPLEQLEQMINGLSESARKVGKDPSTVSVFMTYSNVPVSPASSSQTRFPMTGTIDQIGSDIEQIMKALVSTTGM
jgi:DNA-binding ferritin-like protein